MDRSSGTPESAAPGRKWLSTGQVAAMARVSVTTVAKACADGKVTARLTEGPGPVQGGLRRGRPRQKTWKIEPASGRAYAAAQLQRQEARMQ
jgi:hypothetical protein